MTLGSIIPGSYSIDSYYGIMCNVGDCYWLSYTYTTCPRPREVIYRLLVLYFLSLTAPRPDDCAVHFNLEILNFCF